MSSRLFLSLVLFAAPIADLNQAQQHPVYPPAPAFSLQDSNGHTVTLNEYKGRVVILNFWKSSCLACDRETSNLATLQAKYPARNVVVIEMITGQPAGPPTQSSSRMKFDGPIVVVDKKTLDRYGSPIAPASFLIGRDGRIYSKHSDYVTVPLLDTEVKQLVAARVGTEPISFKPSRRAEAIDLPTESELNADIPGIDTSKLTPAQIKILESRLDSQNCPCGCGGTMLSCRRSHMECQMSRTAAQNEVQKLLSQSK